MADSSNNIEKKYNKYILNKCVFRAVETETC